MKPGLEYLCSKPSMGRMKSSLANKALTGIVMLNAPFVVCYKEGSPQCNTVTSKIAQFSPLDVHLGIEVA